MSSTMYYKQWGKNDAHGGNRCNIYYTLELLESILPHNWQVAEAIAIALSSMAQHGNAQRFRRPQFCALANLARAVPGRNRNRISVQE